MLSWRTKVLKFKLQCLIHLPRTSCAKRSRSRTVIGMVDKRLVEIKSCKWSKPKKDSKHQTNEWLGAQHYWGCSLWEKKKKRRYMLAFHKSKRPYATLVEFLKSEEKLERLVALLLSLDVLWPGILRMIWVVWWRLKIQGCGWVHRWVLVILRRLPPIIPPPPKAWQWL